MFIECSKTLKIFLMFYYTIRICSMKVLFSCRYFFDSDRYENFLARTQVFPKIFVKKLSNFL